jgi:membrane fusion protein (multidrug efflux system)
VSRGICGLIRSCFAVAVFAAACGATLAQPVSSGGNLAEIRAQITPLRYTSIASEVGARISSIEVTEAGSFAKGRLLIAFDCSVQEAQRDKARAEVLAAETQHKANQRLAALNSIGELELEMSRIAIIRARAELAFNQALIDKCLIHAPFPGRVAEQKVREQQFVQPGQVLLDIFDDSSLELEFLIPSAWLRWVKPGLPLRVSIDETRKTYPARFTRIGARVDPVSQSIKVAATIDGRFPELMAGMSGRIEVSPP